MSKPLNLLTPSALSFVTFLLLSACVGTELAVPSTHPGSPTASTGSLPVLSGLRSEFDSSNETESKAHADHADNADATADEPADAVYTCPMHPEIEQSKPGRCPKCGMKLVPKKDEK